LGDAIWPKLTDTGSAVSVVASAAGRFSLPPPEFMTLGTALSCVAVRAVAVFTTALFRSCGVSDGRCCFKMAIAPAVSADE